MNEWMTVDGWSISASNLKATSVSPYGYRLVSFSWLGFLFFISLHYYYLIQTTKKILYCSNLLKISSSSKILVVIFRFYFSKANRKQSMMKERASVLCDWSIDYEIKNSQKFVIESFFFIVICKPYIIIGFTTTTIGIVILSLPYSRLD